MGFVRDDSGWVAQLKAFAHPPVQERCELCAVAIAPGHGHLLEPATRRMVCVCTPCALLFERGETGRFRRVNTRAAFLGDLGMSDEDWRALGVPIDIAFFFVDSAAGRPVAMYPGAAGLVEAHPDPAAWNALAARTPALAALAPDVEALLANRMNGARECYRMPIDRCYALAALIRRHWRGLSGGAEVWKAVRRHFEALRKELRVERKIQ